jgi:hypothetical protein
MRAHQNSPSDDIEVQYSPGWQNLPQSTVYKLAVSGASNITLRLDWEASSLHWGDAVVRMRELLVWEVGVVAKDRGNEALLPCEPFQDAGDFESTLREHVSLVDEEEVSLNLILSKLHLLGLEIALVSSGEVGHKAVVIKVDGGVPERFEGGCPTFNEGLDPEGERLRYLGDDKVGGCIDIDGVGGLFDAFASEALRTRVISGVEPNPLGREIHPIAHRDVKTRNLALVFDVLIRPGGSFVVVIANKLLEVQELLIEGPDGLIISDLVLFCHTLVGFNGAFVGILAGLDGVQESGGNLAHSLLWDGGMGSEGRCNRVGRHTSLCDVQEMVGGH